MLNQIGLELLSYLIMYLPNIVAITFNIIILVFAILIYKRNSYKYGITLMISSIIFLASDIIYLSIQYPFLPIRLHDESGLSFAVISLILMSINFFFLSLYTASAILLVISIIQIYKTHKKDRID